QIRFELRCHLVHEAFDSTSRGIIIAIIERNHIQIRSKTELTFTEITCRENGDGGITRNVSLQFSLGEPAENTAGMTAGNAAQKGLCAGEYALEYPIQTRNWNARLY